MKSKLKAIFIGSTALASGFGLGGVADDAMTFERVPIASVSKEIKGEHVEIAQDKNVVNASFTWRNEQGLTFSYDLGEPTITERLNDKEKQKVSVTEVSNGFKVDIVLYEKPDTNKFCYSVGGYENYSFFKQAPLWEDMGLTGPTDSCSATDCTIDGVRKIRKPEMVNGFSVYHKTLKWNHYLTGKWGDIPFPYVWEIGNEANKIPAEDFTYENGNLCVIAPQKFLNAAYYTNGVQIDPTFGVNTVGGTEQIGFLSSQIYALVATAPETGTLSSISAYTSTSNGDWKGVLSTDESAPVIVTNGVGNATANIDNGWATSTMSTPPSITGSTSYLLGWIASAQGGMWYDTGASGVSYRDTTNSYTTPQDWGTRGARTEIFSIYATYTASGGGGGTVTEEEDTIIFIE